jgi:hypothetical protein
MQDSDGLIGLIKSHQNLNFRVPEGDELTFKVSSIDIHGADSYAKTSRLLSSGTDLFIH